MKRLKKTRAIAAAWPTLPVIFCVLGVGVTFYLSENFSLSDETPNCPSHAKDFASLIHGNTADECEASEAQAYEKKSECITDEFKQRVESVKVACVEHVMEEQMDRRAKYLEKSNAEEALAERRVHRNFLAAANHACQKLNSCEGGVYKIELGECQARSYAARAEQIHLTAKRRLQIDVKSDAVDNQEAKTKLERIRSSGLGGYSSLLCQIPAQYWKGGKVPADCSNLAKFALLPVLGEDCHAGGKPDASP